MTDQQCVAFLQWALPRLGLRWPGFRKVRGQVRKRLGRRLEELGLTGTADYRGYLESHADEWPVLDRLTWISISRFYRDRGVFDHLRDETLPTLAQAARRAAEDRLRCWSAGCASGEEPYTLAILWNLHVRQGFSEVRLDLVATDADAHMLDRARRATYPGSSLKDVPPGWPQTAFTRSGPDYVLRPEFRHTVEFRQQDIRRQMPSGPFHLILCRNLAFTYFSEDVQRPTLERLVCRLVPGGMLVVGKNEKLPGVVERLRPQKAALGIYRAGPSEPEAGSGPACDRP